MAGFDLSSIVDWYKSLSPEAQSSILSTGAGLAGGALQGRAQGQENDKTRANDLAQFIASIQQRQSEMRMNDQQFLDSLAFQKGQADPLVHEKSWAGLGRDRDLMANARPLEMSFDSGTGMGKFTGGFTIPQGGFSADTLARYNAPAPAGARATPPVGQDPTQSGQLATQVAGRAPLGSSVDPVAALQQQQQPTIPDGYEMKNGKLEKKGGGFWRTLGKVASVAAPIVAAPFTGGASLLAIGAGAGAANGLLSGGGVKGALMGAGMGAIPGMGGASGTAASMGTGAALKNAVLNPQAMLRMGGAGVGGKVGSAMQLASMLAPGAKGMIPGQAQSPDVVSGLAQAPLPQATPQIGLAQTPLDALNPVHPAYQAPWMRRGGGGRNY